MTDAPTPKRRRGPPKGSPKPEGSGRGKGTPNRDRSVAFTLLNKSSVDAAKLLDKVMRGHRIEAAPEPGAKKREWWYPTGPDRIVAARIILAKSVPDVKAVEHAGVGGAPLNVNISLGQPAL